jgi:hypothetical protein
MGSEMREKFISKRFNASSEIIIEQANDIIKEYSDEGMVLTVRQLYYQFVSRDFIPNNMRAYKRIVNIVNDARLAGRIDWNAIEDRTRNLQSIGTWNEPSDIIETCLHAYKTDKWRDQDYYVEVWIEKEALTGVIAPICGKLEVPYFACRGYVSQSEQWRAGKRYERMGKECIVIHLGDHDPSGIDMTRDNQDRLSMLSNQANVTVERIALNMPQIRLYNPPPNPAKLTDSRASNYISHFGKSSWELDALEPRVIQNLIRDTVLSYRDEEVWNESLGYQNQGIQEIQKCLDMLEGRE